MYEESSKTISLKEVHDLIDLYKYASIEGERVEFSVKATKDNKRVVSIKIQNGHPRDEDTFVFEEGSYFDDLIYPELLSYFTCDDPLLKWSVSNSETEENLIEGYNETQSGEQIYLSTYKEDYIESVNDKIDKIQEKITYKNTPLTNEDKIWDEILLYANGRRFMQDFYHGSTSFAGQLGVKLIAKLADEDNNICIGKSKKAVEKNEKYLIDLFNNRQDELNEMGINQDIIKEVNSNPSLMKKLATLVGIEKRIRKRLDLENNDILNKINFAVFMLEKVDYFALKNASIDQFENQEFIESKPKAIKKLKEKINDENSVDKEKHLKYCDEILEYLERKSKRNVKIEKTDIKLDDIIFTNHVEGKEELSKEMNDDSVKKEITQKDVTGLLKQFSDYMLEQDKRKEEEQKKTEEKKETDTPVVDGNEAIKGLLKQFSDEMIKKEEENKKAGIPEENNNKVVKDLLKQFSDHMLEKEGLTETKKTLFKISINDIDIASFELISDKYQGIFDFNEMTFNEQKIVEKFFNNKQKLSSLYDEYYDKINTLNKDQLKELTEYEVCLMVMARIEHKFDDKIELITSINNKKKLTPSDKLVAKALELEKEEKYESEYEQVTEFLNKVFDLNINKYEEISKKYNEKLDKYNKTQVEKDKDELMKLIVYKMNLTDSYNALMIKKDSLNEEELKKLAECETRLYKIYEIDVKYVENIDEIIDGLKDKQEFTLPSTKIWISVLKQEKELRDDKKETLFEVVEQSKEEQKSYDTSDLYDAYDRALSYSTINSPACIDVRFEKGNKEEAAVTIYNRIGKDDILVLKKIYKVDDLKNYVIPELRKMFIGRNNVSNNIKFNVAGTDDFGLLSIGNNHNSFNIAYASEELINESKAEIDRAKDKGIRK